MGRLADRRRIGVVICTPEPYHTQLQQRRCQAGDPQALGVPPHVTLLPPVDVAVEDFDTVEKHLAEVAAEFGAFGMRLAGPGTFRPVSQVVFVQVSSGLAECELIHAAIRSVAPLDLTLGFPYHPHVTVAHDVDPAALDRTYDSLRGYEAKFPVCGFTLFGLDDAGVWQVHREFALEDDPEGW